MIHNGYFLISDTKQWAGVSRIIRDLDSVQAYVVETNDRYPRFRLEIDIQFETNNIYRSTLLQKQISSYVTGLRKCMKLSAVYVN